MKKKNQLLNASSLSSSKIMMDILRANQGTNFFK